MKIVSLSESASDAKRRLIPPLKGVRGMFRAGGKKQKAFSQAGYTLVEAVVAGALLLAVLLPATLFLGRFAMSRHAEHRLGAANLAQSEMENACATRAFENEDKRVILNNKTWRIERVIHDEFELITIEIRVFKPPSPKPLARLQTMRFQQSGRMK